MIRCRGHMAEDAGAEIGRPVVEKADRQPDTRLAPVFLRQHGQMLGGNDGGALATAAFAGLISTALLAAAIN